MGRAVHRLCAEGVGKPMTTEVETPLVSIDDVRRWKPDPAPYREALRRASVRPDEAVLVAAHAWDVHAALRLGLGAVWVARLERAWPLPGVPPAARASDLPEAVPLVAAGPGASR